jgi:hypothetical protein
LTEDGPFALIVYTADCKYRLGFCEQSRNVHDLVIHNRTARLDGVSWRTTINIEPMISTYRTVSFALGVGRFGYPAVSTRGNNNDIHTNELVHPVHKLTLQAWRHRNSERHIENCNAWFVGISLLALQIFRD